MSKNTPLHASSDATSDKGAPKSPNPRNRLRKYCLLGAAGVGKTSFVRRRVDSVFDERYLTTLGVRIDKIDIQTPSGLSSGVIWDVHGEEEGREILPAYFRGMAGYLLFVDGTRPDSLLTAEQLVKRLASSVANVPYVLVLSKSDMEPDWQLDESDLGALGDGASAVLRASAKTGVGVTEAFESLATTVLSRTSRAA